MSPKKHFFQIFYSMFGFPVDYYNNIPEFRFKKYANGKESYINKGFLKIWPTVLF